MGEVAYEVTRPMSNIIKNMARKQGVEPARVVRRSIMLLQHLSQCEAAGDTITVRDLTTGESTNLTFNASTGEPEEVPISI